MLGRGRLLPAGGCRAGYVCVLMVLTGCVVVCGSLEDLPWSRWVPPPPTNATRASTEPTETAVLHTDPRSCLDLKETTGLDANGFYFIDPDGPGGFPSFQVTCYLDSNHSKPGTTVIRTPNSIEAPVNTGQRVNVTYDGVPDITSTRALIEASAGCRQFLKYTCHEHGRMIDSGAVWQHVSWLDRNGVELYHGIDCSFGNTCFCTILGTNITTAEVSGNITDTDKLPISGLQVSNTPELADESPVGAFSVGQLECFGKDSTETGSTAAPTTRVSNEVTTVRQMSTSDDASTSQSSIAPESTQAKSSVAPSASEEVTSDRQMSTIDKASTSQLSIAPESTPAKSSLAPSTSEEVTTDRQMSTIDKASTSQPSIAPGSTPAKSSLAPSTSEDVTTDRQMPTIDKASTSQTSITPGSTPAKSNVAPFTTMERESTTTGDETTTMQPSTATTVDSLVTGVTTDPQTTTQQSSISEHPLTVAAAGTPPNINTSPPGQETTKANIVGEIEDSLLEDLQALGISAGNTSTDTLINATKNILGKTSEFLSVQDSVDILTKMSVVSLVESSMTQVALGLRDDEMLQLSLGETKVEVASFSTAESLQEYVFRATGADSSGQSEGVATEEEEEVTLAINTGSFGHVQGPVKVLVVYQGLANGTEERTAGIEATKGSGSDSVAQINSGILSCSVLSGGLSLDVGLEFSLQHKTDSVLGIQDKIATRKCAFWNATLEGWSTKGCRTLTVGKTAASRKTECFCGHNTSFAVLLQVTERPLQPAQISGVAHVLSVLSTVLGIVSVICLALTLIIYAYLWLFKFLPIKVHANLVASLLVAQLLFLTGIEATENLVVCRMVTVLLQLFFSAAFSWMLVEGVLLFQRATMVSRQPPKMLILMLIGWGVPLLLTIISFSIGYHQYGIHGLCWLTAHRGQIWAFLALVMVVILVNVIVVGVVLKTFLSLKMNKDKDNADRVRASFRAVIVLVPILGLSWIFGLLADNSPVFEFLFVIFNSSQGIFVFICHGLMNIEVQKAVKRRRANKVSNLGTSSSEPSQSRSGTQKTMTTAMSSEGGKKEDRK